MPQNPRAVPLPSRIGTHRSVTYSHVSSSSVRFTHRLPSAGRSTRLAETLSLPGISAVFSSGFQRLCICSRNPRAASAAPRKQTASCSEATVG